MRNRKIFDLGVVGAGIVGCATAYSYLRRWPDRRVVLIDKEPRVGAHQTSHNSGVIHAGTYYKPGSLKALNCVSGRRKLISFCQDNGIPFEICGKVIVAVEESERTALRQIYERGRSNGVTCRLVERGELLEREPYVNGVAAVIVEDEGIVSYGRVCEVLAQKVAELGGEIWCGAPMSSAAEIAGGLVLETSRGPAECAAVINCAGLHSDVVAATLGVASNAIIAPFRGEYFELSEEARRYCRNLIYPVPNPNFPFLGAHFTRMIDGKVECGPNAVLALAKEGYRWGDVKFAESIRVFRHKGFRALALRYWREGLAEIWRSVSKRAFLSELRRLIPALVMEDLLPGHSGVRAQAVSESGNLVDDFVIERGSRSIHVLNAPSPAATASFSIADNIIDFLS